MSGDFSTVCSTVGQNFAAKMRNSVQRAANMGLPTYQASATLCDTVKTSAKELSRIMSSPALTAELQALLKRTALGLAIRLILDEYLANRPCFDAFLCVTIRKH
jgi:branched-subunit amino acid ABC-type transport system permease component